MNSTALKAIGKAALVVVGVLFVLKWAKSASAPAVVQKIANFVS